MQGMAKRKRRKSSKARACTYGRAKRSTKSTKKGSCLKWPRKKR